MVHFQSEELKARLRKLAEIAEKKAYEELVKDIKPKKDVDEPFSSYKDQLGFGTMSCSCSHCCPRILVYFWLSVLI